MSLPPSVEDETIAAPSAVNRLATRATTEEIAPLESSLVVDHSSRDVSTVANIVIPDLDRIVDSIAVSVELADDNAASKEDTIP